MRWMRQILVLSGAALAVIACAPESMQPVAKERCGPPRLGHDDDIREAVFRKLFAHDFSGHGRDSGTYFVQVDGGKAPGVEICCWDPSDDLLARFQTHVPPVKPLSLALPLQTDDDGLKDPNTARPAVLFSTQSMCWVSDTEVEVEAESWIHIMGSRSYLYRVVRRSNRWVVMSEELTGVS